MHGVVDSMKRIEKMNLTLTASEISEDYYNKALKRIKQDTAQISLFYKQYVEFKNDDGYFNNKRRQNERHKDH